jgi:hypothetical protein
MSNINEFKKKEV